MAELGGINPLDERLQQALHSIALQYGGRPPQQEAAAPQDAPQVADPYAATPAPAPTGPAGSPYGAYRQEGKPWTQMQFDPQGQFTGISGYRRPDSPVPATPPQSAYTAMAGGQMQPPQQQTAAPQQEAMRAQAPQQQSQFGPTPQPPSAQQAMNYLHSLGYDTSNPDVARLVPRAQQELYKQAMDQYKTTLGIANTQSEITARGATEQRQANPPLNESQSNAALYADRMRIANKIISDPKIGAAGTDLKQANLAKVPVAGNYMVSDEMQQLTQAQRDFINADLRKESGAVISPPEFENARLQYFPQPGDGPKVLAQKAKNRATALAGIERAAGPTYAKGQKQPVAEAPGKIRTYNPTSGKLE